MLYSHQEVDLLQFTLVGSEDEDPPFSPFKVTWRGEIVPFALQVELKCSFERQDIVLTVTPRKDRGYMADEPIPFWREMRKNGIKFIGWPVDGDPIEEEVKDS